MKFMTKKTNREVTMGSRSELIREAEQYEYKCTECGETWGMNNDPECNCGCEIDVVEVKQEEE